MLMQCNNYVVMISKQYTLQVLKWTHISVHGYEGHWLLWNKQMAASLINNNYNSKIIGTMKIICQDDCVT